MERRAFLSLSLGLAASIFSLLPGCASESSQLAPEPGEERSGGEGTVFENSNRAFGLSARNLADGEETNFNLGRSFFDDHWVSAPASTTGRDGLGPTFNHSSCESCHRKDGRGTPPEPGYPFDSILLRISTPDPMTGQMAADPVYGDQIQHEGISGVPGEGTPQVTYVEQGGSYADGMSYSLRVPTYVVEGMPFGDLPSDSVISARTAPHMVGLGLLEAIPEADLLAFSDPDDEDGDGISGRPNVIVDPLDGVAKMGRFGWKSNQIDLVHQNTDAFLGDLGITSVINPDQNCPEPQLDCQEALDGGQPELSALQMDNVNFYTATLAVPARRDVGDEEVLQGRERFKEFGCDGCHVRSFTTGESVHSVALNNQQIWPYTDLLLHDMGEGLSDNRPDHEASGSEWRTPPLWGVGLIETVNGHNHLLHDGRARGFAEAILWHGGEAEPSREAFRNADERARSELIRFLQSL